MIDNRYGVFWNVVFLIGNVMVRYAAATLIAAVIILAVICCCLGGCCLSGPGWNTDPQPPCNHFKNGVIFNGPAR